jgi:hypothetical protein
MTERGTWLREAQAGYLTNTEREKGAFDNDEEDSPENA